MTISESTDPFRPRRVLPDELTECFERLGLGQGDSVVMHASLSGIGIVEGGAGMVLYRLTTVLGKKGALLMPTFTSVTRHASTHNNFTKAGCWCEGRESRHLPFIPDLQPDREIGEIAHRLCSWPASRRSQHPAFSFAAVGHKSDEFVRRFSLTDPFAPLKALLENDPFVLIIGSELDSVVAIHLAEQRHAPTKFLRERALTLGSTGQVWVDVVAPGCSAGFHKLANHISPREVRQSEIGSTRAFLFPMKQLVKTAERVLDDDQMALSCGRPECLSCNAIPNRKF
jgi:aminoglycoside 3-N-acetyltransferase